jgi:hypothetical protein
MFSVHGNSLSAFLLIFDLLISLSHYVSDAADT